MVAIYKRKVALVVTNATDKTIELRATMSAKNSDDAFDLECYIREKLVVFIKGKSQDALSSAPTNTNGVLKDEA